MAYASQPTGLGDSAKVFRTAAPDDVQVVREHSATAVTRQSWAVVTTASVSQIAADVTRVGMLIVSQASGRVYFCFGATAPTSSAFDWYLDPGDRWEVPLQLDELAVSMLGASAGGTVLSLLATAA